jgi:hypothetical protein
MEIEPYGIVVFTGFSKNRFLMLKMRIFGQKNIIFFVFLLAGQEVFALN